MFPAAELYRLTIPFDIPRCSTRLVFYERKRKIWNDPRLRRYPFPFRCHVPRPWQKTRLTLRYSYMSIYSSDWNWTLLSTLRYRKLIRLVTSDEDSLFDLCSEGSTVYVPSSFMPQEALRYSRLFMHSTKNQKWALFFSSSYLCGHDPPQNRLAYKYNANTFDHDRGRSWKALIGGPLWVIFSVGQSLHV